MLDEDTVAQIEHEYRVNTGKTSLTDYDFEKPNTSLMATLSGGGEGADQEGEYYDYPGKHKTKAEGDRYVRIRLEEREVNIQTVRGLSNCMGFECGYKFTLEEHFRDEANQDYTLLALEHRGKNTSYRSGRSEEPFEYTNRFEAIPERGAVPAAAPGAQAGDPRDPDRGGGRQVRRRDLHGQVRPREGAVLLGPRRGDGREQLLLDPRRPGLGRKRLGHRSISRASARRWWSASWKAIRTGR